MAANLGLTATLSSPTVTTRDSNRPRYEVTYFLEASDEGVRRLQSKWATLGEQIEVVGEAGLWNCHIHTDEVGAVLEVGIDVGRPRGVRVVDLSDTSKSLEGEVAFGGFSPLGEVLDAPVGVVAAVDGPGLVERFRRLGAQGVTDRSSAGLADLVAAVDSVPAASVVLLPNSAVLVPLAEQVDAFTTKRVEVVPTRGIPQGLAAMAAYVPAVAEVDGLVDDMAAAAAGVYFGEVRRASRRARVGGWEVDPGDWLGWGDGRVVVADRDRFATLRGLVAALLPDRAGRLTVHSGADALGAELKALEAWVSETHPEVRLEAYPGGQRTSAYLVAVE